MPHDELVLGQRIQTRFEHVAGIYCWAICFV